MNTNDEQLIQQAETAAKMVVNKGLREAMLLAIAHYRHIIEHGKFTWYTDHLCRIRHDLRLIASMADQWSPIEKAPLNTEIVLGWFQDFPVKIWLMEVGLAGQDAGKDGKRRPWRHAQATHWRKCPWGKEEPTSA